MERIGEEEKRRERKGIEQMGREEDQKNRKSIV